ncbi:MAG TPA: N-acetyl-gamma-glutamyl-phosphate reductase [Polyangiaceae bacterium]
MARDASLRVGIVGAAGYTGAELVRLVHGHPNLALSYVAARERAGQKLDQAVPSTAGIEGLGELVLETFDVARASELSRCCDVMFLGLPHEASASAAEALLAAGLVVVDLSAAFRLKDPLAYEPWYGHRHAGALANQAVYGLPELHREELPGAKLIATPGCHVTSALLPLVPLLRGASDALIEHDGIVIDTKTGVSGAGRTPSAFNHFSEAAEGARPYKVAGAHRHTPEIEQELSRVAGASLRVLLTPHLVPMTRGLLATCYARARAGTTVAACREAALSFYRGGLVTILDEGRLPDTLFVRGSARAHVAYAIDERTGFVLAMCAIDNLARGASAEAIQALNVSMGWPDGLGLPQVGIFP